MDDASRVARADEQVLAEVLELMSQLAGDWEYHGVITPETCFLADLGMESLDLVVLGTTIQHRYGRIPFAEFLAEIGQRPVEARDVTVGELVAYICEHRPLPAEQP
jgi:acyl carrier protein